MDNNEKLKALQAAVNKAITHLVDFGKIELGTEQSKALIEALKKSQS